MKAGNVGEKEKKTSVPILFYIQYEYTFNLLFLFSSMSSGADCDSNAVICDFKCFKTSIIYLTNNHSVIMTQKWAQLLQIIQCVSTHNDGS